MAGYVEWDDIERPQKRTSGGGGGNKGKFARIEANKEYIFRPVFKAVRFYKYSHMEAGQFRTAIIDNPDSCTVRAQNPKLKKASERRGFLAFNRDEDNRLQVWELPAGACEAFKHFKKLAKEDPGGPKSGDFKLKCICPSGKKDRDTTYEIEFVEPKPFTEEEKKFIMENVKGKDEWDLSKIFASHTPEEVEKRLFGPPQERKEWLSPEEYKKKKAAEENGGGGNAPAKPAAAAAAAPSSKPAEDDPFQF
jgi:hypothetical protein